MPTGIANAQVINARSEDLAAGDGRRGLRCRDRPRGGRLSTLAELLRRC